MPELPDLLYIRKHLQPRIAGKTIVDVSVREPIVIRNFLDEPFESALTGKIIGDMVLHGPFIRFPFSHGPSLIINLMLAGSIQHQQPGEKPAGHRCFTLGLDDHTALNVSDETKMAKVYCAHESDLPGIPKYATQGIDILSPQFTLDRFKALAARHSRKQVRVFINDQTILSAIGNAYADEILFEAGIHPKTFVARLKSSEIEALFDSILSVLEWGRKMVEEASQPINVKVRNHMRVRNRKGEPCRRCGTTIRREGVRGHDVFFCPTCQPPSRKHFIDWNASR